MSDFKINPRNKVIRVPKRAHYDKETVYKVLDGASICHVSFVQNDKPFSIPTIYGRKNDDIFIHGATVSRLIKNLQQGIDLCLSVAMVDGLVLARSAFHHSMNYRSAVIFGKATLLENDDEKTHALKVISEHVIKDRWDEVREPNKKELKATSVLKIEIEDASAKIRTGGPIDDKEDYELNIWAGVVPMKTVFDSPFEDEESLKSYPVPKSVKSLF